MYEFSTVDGFIDVNRGLEEMIKYLANEPSVGLFFVQQHAQNAMPNLLNLKDKVVEKTYETILHTEDLEDSVCAVRSMTECGLSITDGMIKDINKSLLLMSTAQPRKGLIRSPSWGFQMSRGISKGPAAISYVGNTAQHDEGSSRSYLTAVFNSAKQRAVKLRWSQPDSSLKNPESEVPVSSSTPTGPIISIGTPSQVDTDTDELPLSSPITDEQLGERGNASGSSSIHDLSPALETFDKFKSEQQAKLEEWLQESEELGRCNPQEEVT